MALSLARYRRRLRLYRHWTNWANFLVHGRVRGGEDRLYRLGPGLRVRLRPEPSGDFGVLKEMIVNREYGDLIEAIPEGGTVLDIGANIGLFSLCAARAAKPAAVYAFEPHPDNFRLLRENIALNRLGRRIHALPHAVAGAAGERVLHVETAMGRHSLVAGAGPGLRVSCVTLAGVLDAHRIGGSVCLKIDCEGAEHEILGGAPPGVLDRLQAIGGEYHDVGGRDLFDALARRLSAAGFDVRRTKRNRHGDGGLFFAIRSPQKK
jgi:FkbM family methyltransferase